MHLSIYTRNIKKSIYCDDKSGFLRLPSRYCRSYFRWLFTFLTLENRVIATFKCANSTTRCDIYEDGFTLSLRY